MLDLETTICALASGNAQAGVAVIRLSGPQAVAIVKQLCPSLKQLTPRQAHYTWLVNPSNTDEAIDDVLVIWFKAPNSLTGEDCVEIHCHGGLKLTELILNYCLQLGAQLASPGEFSRRAVLNGKISLSQAESVLDLIHAENELLIKAAAKNLKYQTLQKWVAQFATQVAKVQADMVASIDFPDEVDEPDRKDLSQQLLDINQKLQGELKQAKQNQVLRDGLEIAILGKPNAGKSSLFNALLKSDRAIVTDIAGTTRDVITEKLMINGLPVTLFDTAGLRSNTNDKVEQIGIEKAQQTAEQAEILIYVLDGTKPLEGEELKAIDYYSQNNPNGLVVLNKQDEKAFNQNLLNQASLKWPIVGISTQTLLGLDELQAQLLQLVQLQSPQGHPDFVLSSRQLNLLKQVKENLEIAIQNLKNTHLPLDLVTVHLTDALELLSQITGQDLVEEVLDSVFSRFCVGK